LSNRTRLIVTSSAALLLAVVIAVWHAERGPEEVEAMKQAALPAAPAALPPVAAGSNAPAPPAPGPAAAAPGPPPAAPAPSANGEAAVARMNEAVLMARLREVAKTDSVQAIALARAGNKKYPDSSDAPERASILIHALVTQNQLSEGRAEAEYMVNHYPDSSWVRDIEGFTGAHRHRNIRVNDAGQLEYY
jgi:hypothetical protein